MGPRGFRGAQRRGRRRGLIVGAAIGSAAARRNNNDDSVSEDTGQMDQMDELQKLGELRDSGILTEDEFQAKKKQILGI